MTNLTDKIAAQKEALKSSRLYITELEAKVAHLNALVKDVRQEGCAKIAELEADLVKYEKLLLDCEAERDRLKTAVSEIARQRTTADHRALSEDPEDVGDVEYAYDTIIGVARAALSSTPSGE